MFERVYGNLVEETGAVIMGRRSYDNSIAAWGGKGPLDEVPCYVVTHRPPARTWSMSCSEGAVGCSTTPAENRAEQIGLSQTDGVTHLEYRVLR